VAAIIARRRNRFGVYFLGGLDAGGGGGGGGGREE
jgi:hypothetical protein